jgi:4-aminobutyrate aminotransferase-like enzyme
MLEVGLAAIDIILREKLPESSARVGMYLKSRLSALMDSHPIIGEVRGRDLSLFPPLNIDEEIANQIVEIMDKALHTGAIAELSRKARLLKEFAISKL